jgi:tetratricopeptide (TPR) repeat protein
LAAQVYAHSQAEALLEDGLRLTQVDDDESLSATLLVIDNVLKACGRVDEAEGRLIALLEKTQEAGFQSLYCQALGSLGDLLLRTGRANEARPIFCRAIDGFDELGNVDAVAETRRRMGLVHHVQGRYQAALSDYEDALGLARQVGALAVARRSLGSIANLHSETGEYKLALAFFSEAIASSNEDDDRRMVNSFIANTGLVHYRLGQYPAALAHYQRSLALARELGDWPGVGHDLGSIGLVHLERGLPERALAFFVEALKIAREVEDRRLEAAWLGNLAWVRWKQRSVELALDLSAEALEIAREVGDSEQEAMWLHSLGLIQERLAQKISARDYQTKALEIAHATENRNQEVRVLVALSRLDRLDGRRPEALAWLERASAMPQKTVFRLVSGAYHCERSWLALASNEPARPSFDQAREIADALELTPGADLRVALEELSQALDGQNGQTDGLG